MGTHPIFESDFDCLTDAPLYMNSVGENATTVRYDPALTKIRHENEELRLDLDRRRGAERELRKRLERAERRIQEGEKMTPKLESARRQNQKLERQLKSLKKYLSELPTRDEYKKLQSEKTQLLESSQFMENEMATIKEKLKSFTVSVDHMSRERNELAHELEQARQRIEQLGASSNGSLHDSEEVAEQLRQQCAAIMAKLKEEKVNQADHQKRHQTERDQLAQTVKLLQESQINLSRQNARLKMDNDQLSGRLEQCGGAERITGLREKITGLIDNFDALIGKAQHFQKSTRSDDIYYPDETDDPSDDLLLDLDETHAQVIRDANSTEPDSSLDELETKLEKMSGAICEMEAAEMANACQIQ